MARQKAVDAKIQVTRGFVTEFTPVGFPQEAAIDIDNCIIDTDGSVRRRPGIDLEQNFVLNDVNGGVLAKGDLETQAFSTHLWEFVSNSGTLNIVVQQVGTILQFYAQIGAVSANFLGEVDVLSFAVNAAEIAFVPFEMTSGLGALFIVNEHLEPLKITFDGASFTVTTITIQERDFKGLDDGLEIDERPTVLTRSHYYNLLNQGWTDENINTFAGTSVNLCAATGSSGGLAAGSGNDFPSNSDIMTVGIVVNSDGDLAFDPSFIREDFLGNTPAPKGHFILDAFDKRLDVVADCSGIGSEITPNRPQAIAFHQGRIFYSSPVVQNKGNGIFYSQNLLSDDRAAKCFQEADPTAAEINDLIATDGGFLPIPGVGQVLNMQEFGNGVIILASNGVWYITGADVGSAVTATSLRLDKVHPSGALSASSVMQAEGQLYYFGIEGIMQIALDEAGSAIATNISQNSIQQFYVNISATARERATAVYIPEQRKLHWAYRDTAKDVTQTLRNANKMLILDLDVKGFYKYTIGEDSANNFPEIMGLALVKPIAAGTVATLIITETDLTPVTLTDGSTLTQDIDTEGAQVSTLKMATMAFSNADSGYKMTFATITDRAFVDWRVGSSDGLGLPMASFVEFAEFNMGGQHTKGRPTYVHSYFSKTSKNLEPGGYYELPPLFYASVGLRMSQSVLELLVRPASKLRLTQSAIEVLTSPSSDFRLTQSVLEVIDLIALSEADRLNLNAWTWEIHIDTEIMQAAIDFMIANQTCNNVDDQLIFVDRVAAETLLNIYRLGSIALYDSTVSVYVATKATFCI